MAGAQMVLAQIRLVADAIFDLFQRRIRDPWQLRGLAPRTTGLALLHPPSSEKCRGIIRARERSQGRHEHRRYRPGSGARKLRRVTQANAPKIITITLGGLSRIPELAILALVFAPLTLKPRHRPSARQ